LNAHAGICLVQEQDAILLCCLLPHVRILEHQYRQFRPPAQIFSGTLEQEAAVFNLRKQYRVREKDDMHLLLGRVVHCNVQRALPHKAAAANGEVEFLEVPQGISCARTEVKVPLDEQEAVTVGAFLDEGVDDVQEILAGLGGLLQSVPLLFVPACRR